MVTYTHATYKDFDHIQATVIHPIYGGTLCTSVKSLEPLQAPGQICYVKQFIGAENQALCGLSQDGGKFDVALHLCSSSCLWSHNGLTWNGQRYIYLVHCAQSSLVLQAAAAHRCGACDAPHVMVPRGNGAAQRHEDAED